MSPPLYSFSQNSSKLSATSGLHSASRAIALHVASSSAGLPMLQLTSLCKSSISWLVTLSRSSSSCSLQSYSSSASVCSTAWVRSCSATSASLAAASRAAARCASFVSSSAAPRRCRRSVSMNLKVSARARGLLEVRLPVRDCAPEAVASTGCSSCTSTVASACEAALHRLTERSMVHCKRVRAVRGGDGGDMARASDGSEAGHRRTTCEQDPLQPRIAAACAHGTSVALAP